MRASFLLPSALAILATTPAYAASVVFSSTGDTPAVTVARDAFRAFVGGGTVAGANGSFGGLRREINWDGVPASFSAPNTLPANFFNANSPRGVVFSTPGTGFMVSGATSDVGAGQPAAAGFGNIDPSYTAVFSAFSPQRLFTAAGSNIVDVTFFLPGTTTAATVSSFGAIFSDVDLNASTSIQYFDAFGASLGTFFAAGTPGSQGFSFLGVGFNAGERIGRVRITSGNAALGAGVTDQNGNSRDLVVMDDFLYSEPLAVPEPAAWLLMLGGFGVLGWQLRRQRAALRFA